MGSLVVATSPPPTRLSVLPLRQVVTHRRKGHLHRHTVLENGRHHTARAQAWSFLGPFLLPAPPGFDSPALTPRLQQLPAAARRQSEAPRTASPLVASARTRPSAQDGRLPSGLPGSRSTEGPTDPSVCSGATSSTAGAPAAPEPGLTMDLLTD